MNHTLRLSIVLLSVILLTAVVPRSGRSEDPTEDPERKRLVVEPMSLEFTVPAVEPETKMLAIKNIGTGPMRWVALGVDDWIVLDKKFGVVDEHGDTIAVSVNPEGLEDGVHRSKIVVNSIGGTKEITVMLTVSDAEHHAHLASIQITAYKTELMTDERLFFTAKGVYSDGSVKDITSEVTWRSSDKRVARFIEKGVLNGESPGETTVTAHYESFESDQWNTRVVEKEGSVLWVLPRQIDIGNIEVGCTEERTITVRKKGRDSLLWEAVSEVPWIVFKNPPEEDDVRKKLRRVSGEDIQRLHLVVDTTSLEEGKHRGIINVLSNTSRERVVITANIVSLQSLSISPVAIRIGVGQKRPFSVVGTWSDGTQTDISGANEGQWVLSDDTVGSFNRTRPIFAAREPGRVEIQRVRGPIVSNTAVVIVEELISEPVLLVSPRELDMGGIGPSEEARLSYQFKNVGTGNIVWTAHVPEEWTPQGDGEASGVAGQVPRFLTVVINSEKPDYNNEMFASDVCRVVMTLTGGQQTAQYTKYLPTGKYREMIRVTSNGGARHLFVAFELKTVSSRPELAVFPHGIDFGTVDEGESGMKKIHIANVGKNVLKWSLKPQGKRRYFNGVLLPKGRYLSLKNDHLADEEDYHAPDGIADDISLSGTWTTRDGYPEYASGAGQLKYTFYGKGFAVSLVHGGEDGQIRVSIDGTVAGSYNYSGKRNERSEFLVTNKLSDGIHVAILEINGAPIVIEGMTVYASNIITQQSNWLRVFPEKGTTTNEIDYCNVMINSQGLAPGVYAENILFSSNGGNERVYVSLEVAPGSVEPYINFYRFVRGENVILSHKESLESEETKEYTRQGVAFRLFAEEVPGTTQLYQWRIPETGEIFLSPDMDEDKLKRSLGKDYVFDGAAGNIATVKLEGVRELFQWYDPETDSYFYSTDAKGEGMTDRGYQYDGMIGYVK